jgi:ribosome maturation factor RimP
MFLPIQSKDGQTVLAVWQLAEPIAERLGLVLWDIQFVKEGASHYLRVFIDKEEGVSLDDCVDMSHALDGPLDEADPIDCAYSLQVSSPGVERELTRDFHFDAYLGERVRARLIRPFENLREYTGTLTSFDAETGAITLEISGERSITINKKETSWIRVEFIF